MTINKKIILLSTFFSIKVYAQNQNYFANDKPFEPEAIQAPGVDRIGASPLPMPSFSNLPVGQTTPVIETTKQPQIKKGSFESTYTPGRVLFLNGENISSIRNQELENVNIRIDKNGNIYIEAPQYEVSTEQSYHPLLPKELPKFKKENVYEQMPLPQGVFSKETGKSTSDSQASAATHSASDSQPPVTHSAEAPAPMAKEIVPEVNTQAKIPPVNLDGIKPPTSN